MWERLRKRIAEIEATLLIGRPALRPSSFRRIAVCGHTNVGKSSFVNALVGEKVAAVRSRETTALPILIRFGTVRRRRVRRNGTLVDVGAEVSGETVDDERDALWTGFIVDVPQPFLRSSQLIDTPGIGGTVNAEAVYDVVRRCEIALVLFNKPDRDMISPVYRLRDVLIVGIRTQADDPETGTEGYDEERDLTRNALEKATGGFAPPFVYVGTQPISSSLGSVFVPTLATRLDNLFHYRNVVTRINAALAILDDAKCDLEREEQSVSAQDATTIYDAWPTIKDNLDRMKRRGVHALAEQDATWLKSIVRVPIGRAAWERIIQYHGAPPFHVGMSPSKQYVALSKWFDRFQRRSKLDRRKHQFTERSRAPAIELSLLRALAGAMLAHELGDPLSAVVLRRRFEATSAAHDRLQLPGLEHWKQFAPMLWKDDTNGR